jgi:hypothetical protein
MQAAVERSSILEEENDVLRGELAELRRRVEELRTATASAGLAEPVSGETRALADKALDVLQRMEAVSQRPAKVRVAAETSLGKQPAEHADVSVLAVPGAAPRSTPSSPAPPRRDGISGGAVFACVVSFVLGLLASRLLGP